MFVADVYGKEMRKIDVYRTLLTLENMVGSVISGGMQLTLSEFEALKKEFEIASKQLGLPTPDPRTPIQLYEGVRTFREVIEKKFGVPEDPYTANGIDRL